MFNRLKFLFAGCVAMVACCLPLTTYAQVKIENTPVDGKVDWVFDYEKGKELSKKNGKPMFVVFRCER